MDTKNTENLEYLVGVRKEYHSKAFRFFAQSAVIFGAPAFLAYVFGTNLDRAHNTGKRYVLIFLGIAFVLSWVIVIVLSRKLDRGLRGIEARIQEVKKSRREPGLLKPIEHADVAVTPGVVYNKPGTWKSPNKK